MNAYDRAINLLLSYAAEVKESRKYVITLPDKLKLLATAKRLDEMVRELRLMYFDVEDGHNLHQKANPALTTV